MKQKHTFQEHEHLSCFYSVLLSAVESKIIVHSSFPRDCFGVSYRVLEILAVEMSAFFQIYLYYQTTLYSTTLSLCRRNGVSIGRK